MTVIIAEKAAGSFGFFGVAQVVEAFRRKGQVDTIDKGEDPTPDGIACSSFRCVPAGGRALRTLRKNVGRSIVRERHQCLVRSGGALEAPAVRPGRRRRFKRKKIRENP
jgi:hypothetical protein